MEGRAQPQPQPAVPSEQTVKPPLPRQPHSPSLAGAGALQTYIVQIPRDQVYRIPPPEHTQIVESYRCPSDQTSNKWKENKCLRWTLISFAVIAVAVATIVVLVHLPLNPKTPQFSVTKVLVKKASHHHTNFDITLEAKNPNRRMGVSYQDGGEASLFSKQQKLAEGTYPLLSQDAGETSTVHLNLTSIKDTTLIKGHVSLSVTINVPVKIKGLTTVGKELSVACDFKATNLGSTPRISSQNCDSQLGGQS